MWVVSGTMSPAHRERGEPTEMKPAVYLETTIVSYLTAWRSPELVMAARQEITRE